MSEEQRKPERRSGPRSTNTPTPTPLGSWIRRARFEQRLSQRDLAARAGLSRSYICNIERGASIKPSIRSLDKLAAALGASRSEMLALAGIIDSVPGSAGKENESRFLTLFRALSLESQHSIERFARFLQSEELRWQQQPLIGVVIKASDEPEQQQGPTLFDLDAVQQPETAECNSEE